MQYFGFDRPSFGIKTFGFGSSEFSPLELFAGGKQGVFYDPSDKSTLFQDVAGTVPVTKDGDPVALMRDKSGNGNHAKQTASTARPLYKTDGILHWLLFDGVDDHMIYSVNIGVSSTVSVAVRYYDNAVKASFFIGDGVDSAKIGTVGGGLFYRAVTNGWSITISGTAGLNYVLTSGRDNKTPFGRSNGLESKGSAVVDSTVSTTWTTLGTAATSSTGKLVGNIYGVIIVDSYSAESLQRLEQYLAVKAGVTL